MTNLNFVFAGVVCISAPSHERAGAWGGGEVPGGWMNWGMDKQWNRTNWGLFEVFNQ